MHYALIFVLLLAFVLGLGLLARRLKVPYPILFVIGGLVIGIAPHAGEHIHNYFTPDHLNYHTILPNLTLDPDFVFFIFLPPLLYIQAFNTSWRDFKRELRPISMLAVGLVVATTVAVAYTAHWMIPNFPLSAGFVLGAIVSPPDAVAAAAIAERLGLPRRLVTILEGESLVNDATSLVIFKVALGATALHGAHLFGNVVYPGEFLWVALGGIAIGLGTGRCIDWLRRRIVDAGPEIYLTVSLITPYLSYLVGEFFHVSSVLAVVSCGLLLGRTAPLVMTSSVRLQAQAFWEMIIYLLNGMIFVLIGVQLPSIMVAMHENPLPQFLGGTEVIPLPIIYGIVIFLVCVVVRMIWIFPGAYLPIYFSKRIRETEPIPDWQQVFVGGWAGMRGVVSLAAALALNGYPMFPRGHLVQFISFCVIFGTLVVQGLTLPPLIRYLGVGDDGASEREELEARRRLSEVVLKKIVEIRDEQSHPISAIDSIEQFYRERDMALRDELADQLGWSSHRHHVLSSRRLRRLMIATQRRALVDLRHDELIGDDVLHKIEHELDLDEARYSGK